MTFLIKILETGTKSIGTMVFAELGYSRNQFGAGKCLTKVQFGRRNHDNVAAMENAAYNG